MTPTKMMCRILRSIFFFLPNSARQLNEADRILRITVERT